MISEEMQMEWHRLRLMNRILQPLLIFIRKKSTMHIPFGVGLKYKFNHTWAIFAEATFRYTDRSVGS
jgi:hypothetical protein